VPGSIAHCCCLHLEAKKKRNELLHLLKNKKFYKRRILRDESIPTNDRLLHYAPYRIVIAPSFRFFETLCVAEQGQTKDTDHQEPIFHSVIPNPLAMDYDNRMIYPSGSWSDVIVDQRFSYIAVENPFETSRELSYFMVKRVLVKYSNDFTSHPEKGSCCLYDENYFKSCFLI
jgi:hypothetical protein